jgi:hypothetical protein
MIDILDARMDGWSHRLGTRSLIVIKSFPLSAGAAATLATTLPICLTYFALVTRSMSHYPWSHLVPLFLGAFGLYLPECVPVSPHSAEGDSHDKKVRPCDTV